MLEAVEDMLVQPVERTVRFGVSVLQRLAGLENMTIFRKSLT